jgi:peroxiredoxin
MMFRSISIFVLGALLPCVTARADEPSTPAGHSNHGESFNEGPRQKAYLMDGMPDIDFAITTKTSEAQKFFNQGVGQLHGFWYFEAERSFRQVAMLDTNCAMAYWGMAMANVLNEKRAKQFIEKAVTLTNGLGRREFLYVQSLAKFYLADKDKKDDKAPPANDRHRQYVKSLEQIIEEFPGDIEAKAFLVFKIWDNNGRLKISSHTAADALAQQVLAERPLHPVHHALIHLWNNEADRRARDSAAKCGQGSPGIAHMWHMPGHTWSALHRYSDAAWQQEASARVDHAYMIHNRILPDQIHNYAHNNDWLVKNLSYLGRVHDAIDLAKNLVELPRHPKYNNLSRFALPESLTNAPYPGASSTNDNTTASNRRESSAAFGRNRLCELMVRWELWDDLIALGQTEYLEPTDFPDQQARRAKAVGLAYFAKGDIPNGEAQIAAIERAIQQQKDLRQAEMEEAETEARKAKKSDEQIRKAMTDALDAHTSRVKSMLSSLAELKLYQSLAQENKDAAKEQLEDLKEKIPKERLAHIYLKLDDQERAEKRAREAAEDATNQVNALANYIDILSRCGKDDEARKQFEKLRTNAPYADLDMPIFKRIAPVAESVGLAANWRAAHKPARDVGDRPSLDKLGPLRWHPSPAPEWTLRDSDNRKVSSRDYRGTPIVLIFYLGYGCVHCLEQLNLFAPMAAEYERAGIKIVAVGTDSVEGLAKTFEKSRAGNGFPFQIVSNQKLDVFKAYRAYDDFEKMALHGTFLVDGDGLVRWQDISYEPFTEPRFLLGEAKRLLKLPTAPLLTKGLQKDGFRSPKANDSL